MISFKLHFLKGKFNAEELGRKNNCKLLKCDQISKPHSQVEIFIKGFFFFFQ